MVGKIVSNGKQRGVQNRARGPYLRRAVRPVACISSTEGCVAALPLLSYTLPARANNVPIDDVTFIEEGLGMGSTGKREKGSGLQLSLLGSFAAMLGGKRVDSFRTSKVQALLIYLLLQRLEEPDGRVTREQMMALLWPEKSGKRARDNLRQALYHLRKMIPELTSRESDGEGAPVPFVLSDRQHVWINPEAGYSLDVARFMRLCEAGSYEELAEAVELSGGDFLADFYLEDSSEFENWVAGWRAQLRRQMMDALERLVEANLERGKAEEAVRYARLQLALDDLRESAHRQAMVALSRMGRRAEAVRQYERCRKLLEEELGVAPSAETKAVLEAVREGEARGPAQERTAAAAARARSRLPEPDNPLIGRERELAEVLAFLQNDARLVSVVGPGGIGKTRLALEVAHRLVDDAGYRAIFVNLAPVMEMEEIAPAVVRALELESDQGDSEAIRRRLLEYLRDRRLLLVLDNAEHLLGGHPLGIAELVGAILQTAPNVRLLVTSREPLKLRAEQVYPLSGLAYKEWTTPVEAAREPAVQLFLHHAQRVRPAFRLRSEHLEPLQAVVQLTEGMPLALILAAGWVKVLTPAEIAAELERSLDFLEATHRDVPARQQSVRAVFDATWARLSEREQALFAALSVFRGGFTREAAEAVTGASARELLMLVDRSLLYRRERERFDVQELLRQFAAEKLEQAGASQAVRDAHSAFYMEGLGRLLPKLKGPEQLAALDAIEADFDNVRLAWRRACESDHWEHFRRACESLCLFALMRGPRRDCRELFDLALDALPFAKSGLHLIRRAYLLAGRAGMFTSASEKEAALPAFVDLYPAVEVGADAETVAYFEWGYGFLLRMTERYAEATVVLSRARTAFEELGDVHYLASALRLLADSMSNCGRSEEALVLLQEALSLARCGGSPSSIVSTSLRLGRELRMLEGPSERAERYLWQGVRGLEERGEKMTYAEYLAKAANLRLWREGDVVSARPHVEEALTTAEELDVEWLRLFVLPEVTTHHLVEGDYEAALSLSGEVVSKNAWPEYDGWARLQHGIALLAMDVTDEALPFMKQGLATLVELDQPGFLSSFLPFFGIVFAGRGEPERAVELLARGFTQPHASGRLEIDPLITRFRAEMETTLGEERFAASWARGKELDAMSTAVEVLAALDVAA